MIIYLTSCTTQTLQFHPSWGLLAPLMLLCWATVEMCGFYLEGYLFLLGEFVHFKNIKYRLL